MTRPSTRQRAILVTGGAGYIGSHTCKALAHAGFLPVVYDDLSRGFEHNVKWGPLIKGQIADTPRLITTCQRFNICAVVHFAASAYVGESVTQPLHYWRNNVGGSISLLEAMRQRNIEHVVFSSTCATYGVPNQEGLGEHAPQKPVNPYGHTKLAVEQILHDAFVAFGLKSIILRYFNAAGADADLELGEEHTPETHLIPLALRASTGGPPLTIFGDDWPTADGTCVRDFVHVSDLAEAHVLAVRHLLKGASDADAIALPPRAYNLGQGQGASVLEVINMVQEVTGKKVVYRIGPKRAGDPPLLVAKADRAQTELLWRPKQSSLRAIVQSAWAFESRRTRFWASAPSASESRVSSEGPHASLHRTGHLPQVEAPS